MVKLYCDSLDIFISSVEGPFIGSKPSVAFLVSVGLEPPKTVIGKYIMKRVETEDVLRPGYRAYVERLGKIVEDLGELDNSGGNAKRMLHALAVKGAERYNSEGKLGLKVRDLTDYKHERKKK